MFKKSYVFFLILALMIFTACGGKKTTESAAKKDTIIVGVPGVKILDPHVTNDLPSSRIFSQILEPLVKQDHNMEIVPGVAESWEQVDPTTLVFHLRKNAKFHNGDLLKASDVKFSLDRAIASPQVGAILNVIKNIEIVDDNTIKITTSTPFAPLLNHLAHAASSIISERAYKELGASFGQNPVGTGPFKFVEWKSGDSITLAAFEDYYLGETPIKNLVFKLILDGTNRTIGLETKEIDVAYDMEAMDSDKVKDDPNLVLLEKPSLTISFIGLNTRKAPYDNVKVRQAIAYLIDKKAINETVYQGYAENAPSIIAPKVFGFSSDVKEYYRDVEKAKELLAEAGYPDGFKAVVWTNDSPVRRDIAVILQDQLKAGGIDLVIETLEWGAYLEGTARGDHEMYILGWGASTGDGDYGLRNITSSKTMGSGGNRSFYNNPEVDRLLDLGVEEIDPAKRLPIYKEIQQILSEDVPLIPISYPVSPVGLQKNIKGFEFKPDGKHSLYGVYFE